MNLLTRHSDYAVQALCYMTTKKSVVAVSELCKELHMPKAFLRGILQNLTNAGILHSTKGKNGGFALARMSDTIRLLDVVIVFQGPVKFSRCIFRRKSCARQSDCRLRQCLVDIEHTVIRSLSSCTIEQLSSSLSDAHPASKRS